MQPKKILSKKIARTLLAMSFVYWGGTSAIIPVEAGDYTFTSNMTGAFVPTADSDNNGSNSDVIRYWKKFKALKDKVANADEYAALLKTFRKDTFATEANVNSYMQITQAIDDVVLTANADNYNNRNDVEVKFGANNVSLVQTNDGIHELLGLNNAGHSGVLSGSGTLTLQHESDIGQYGYTLLRVGSYSLGSGENLTINMGKLIINGTTSSVESFTGINLNGSSQGNEKIKHDALIVKCDTEIKLTNTEISGNNDKIGGPVKGIYIDGEDGAKETADFQALKIGVTGAREAVGIHILSGNGNQGLLNINGASQITVASVGKDTERNPNAYVLYNGGAGGSNKIVFKGEAVLEGSSTFKNAYGINSAISLGAQHTIDFSDTAKITVEGKGRSVGSWLSSESGATQTLSFAKKTDISVTSQADTAYGILASTGTTDAGKKSENSYAFNGPTTINVTSAKKDALAVCLQADTEGISQNKIDFKKGLEIVGTAEKGRTTALYAQTTGAEDASIINVNGATLIRTSGKENDYVAQGSGSGTVINVNVHDNPVNGSKVVGVGHIAAKDGAKINWNMDTAESSLQGCLYSGADGELNVVGDGAVIFEGKSAFLQGKAGKTTVDFKNEALWKLTASSELTDLKLNSGAVVDMCADGGTYSTLKTVGLNGNDGVIKQDIDVREMKRDKILVSGDFSGTQALDIYQKDNYIPDAGSTEGTGLVLASVNGNGVFTAKDREGTLFYSHYDLAAKASATDGFATDWYLNKIIKKDDPTTSVDTILAASALNYYTWRTENDKLLQRMGELRHNGVDAKGAWFRVRGSKIGRDSRLGFENQYKAYELGYDELVKNTEDVKRYQGFALSYTDGNSSYSRGSGDNSSKAISFYNTDIGSKGHYLDVVLKISNMDNDFTVYDTNAKKITGDFDNTGVSLSAEYGRKNELNNGWYIEPQAQFTLGYLGGDNYLTDNNIEVQQSGIKSAVGRVGFNIGKAIGAKGIVYAKANLLHEFGGGYDVTMSDSSGRVKVSDSFDDTWFEYGVGAAFATGTNSNIYFDVERSSGSDFKKDWQWNVGARWNF